MAYSQLWANTGSAPTQTLNGIDIGKWGSYFYSGSIDDFPIYNRVLTATEVKQLYHMGR